jgi:predicted RNase H-like nuclease (RuvC/YqgF family)
LEKIEIETQTEAPTTIETTVQTEEVFHSPEQDVIVKRLEAKLEQSQQTLSQCRSEMVTVSEHQKVVRQLRAMLVTKNETFDELIRAKEKVKKVQGQLDGVWRKSKKFSLFILIL